MRKNQAINIISHAAKIYNEQLCTNNLLIVFGIPNIPEFIEIMASSSNFLHLTGVKLNKDIKDNSAETFFENARDGKLKEEEFDFKDNTTEQKIFYMILTFSLNWGIIIMTKVGVARK